MALSQTTLAKASFKILNGKAHTSNSRELVNETKQAWVQLAAANVFGDRIDAIPANAVTAGVAQAVTAVLAIDPGTSLSYQAFYPVGHAKAGQPVTDIIPQAFGTGYRPVLKSNGVEIAPLDARNWYCVTSSGVITSETALSLTNGTLECYVFTGDFVSDKLTAIVSGSMAPAINTYTLSGTDIANGYVNLNQEALAASVIVNVKNAPLQFHGEDFTLSVVSDVTRVTFSGDMSTHLASGDKMSIQFMYLPA